MDGLWITVVLSTLVAFAATAPATALARRWAKRWSIVDRPDGGRKQQQHPVPLLGGVAVVGGWLAAFAFVAPLHLNSTAGGKVFAVIISTVFLCAIGARDDARRMRVRWKLLAQIGATLPLVAAGLVIEHVHLLGLDVPLGHLAAPFTIVWYLAGINALNFIDGMDGLAATCGICGSLIMAILAASLGMACGAAGGAALAGALAGFLLFNFPPARIYLGDAGSMAVGLLMSWLAVEVTTGSGQPANLTVLFLLMALPLTDMLLAIFRRAVQGKCVWVADRAHVHHRLLGRGFSIRQTLAVLALVSLAQTTLAAGALAGDWDWLAVSSGIISAAVLVGWKLVGHEEFRLARGAIAGMWTRQSASTAAHEEFVGLTFEETWLRILAETSRFPVRSVRANFGPTDPMSREHVWTNFADDLTQPLSAPGEPLVIQIRVSAVNDEWCHLALETDTPSLEGREEFHHAVSLCRQLADNLIRKRQRTIEPAVLQIPTRRIMPRRRAA